MSRWSCFDIRSVIGLGLGKVGYRAVLEGRVFVDLDQPSIEVGIDHVVDPKDLVAIRPVLNAALRP